MKSIVLHSESAFHSSAMPSLPDLRLPQLGRPSEPRPEPWREAPVSGELRLKLFCDPAVRSVVHVAGVAIEVRPVR